MSDLHDPRGDLRRVDVDPQGTAIAIRPVDGAERWCVLGDDAPRPLEPGSDPKLPLGRLLAGESDLRCVAYRPGRRMVLLDAGGPQPRYLKGYRRSRLSAAREAHLAGRRANLERGFRTAELIAAREDLACLVFAHLEGTRPEVRATEAVAYREVGVRLRAMQESEPPPITPFGAREELLALAGLVRRFETVRSCFHTDWVAWTKLVHRLEDRAGSLPRGPAVPAHRDLHDGQLLVGPGGPGLLDFDLFTVADSALDAANLSAHLELRQLQGRADAEGATTCTGALLEGLGREAEAGFAQRLAFYRATSFLRLALIYSLRLPWVELTPRLIERADDALEAEART